MRDVNAAHSDMYRIIPKKKQRGVNMHMYTGLIQYQTTLIAQMITYFDQNEFYWDNTF